MAVCEPLSPLERVREDYRALRIVSPAYAGREGELTSVLQYVYQSVFLGAQGYSALAGKLERIAAEELRHLQLLGSLVSRLGAPPVFTACPPYPVAYYSASSVNYAKTPSEMIEADIRMERASAAAYARMLEGIENDGAAELLTRLKEEELAHLSLLLKIREEGIG